MNFILMLVILLAAAVLGYVLTSNESRKTFTRPPAEGEPPNCRTKSQKAHLEKCVELNKGVNKMEFNCKFGFGDKLKSKVSDFHGIVMGISFYSSGCTHYGLQSSKLKEDGTEADYQWMDESKLDLVHEKVVSFREEKKGGPGCNPPKMWAVNGNSIEK